MSFNIREGGPFLFPFFLFFRFFCFPFFLLSPDILYRIPEKMSFDTREESLFFSVSLFPFLGSSRALSPDILYRHPKEMSFDTREEPPFFLVSLFSFSYSLTGTKPR